MFEFSRLSDIPASATTSINDLANQKKRAGERIYNLSAGEPMVDMSDIIIDAAKKAMDTGKTHYPPVAGIPELRESATRWMNRYYSASFSSKEILVTCGGKHAINLALQAVIDPGDEVVFFGPYWVSYSSISQLFGGKAKIIMAREENEWKVKPEEISAVCTSRTKVLIINNASNPTGVLYSREELGEILRAAKQNNLLVISDEVYSGLTYEEEFVSAASFPEYRDNTLIIQSCSKNFAMTGMRIGFVFGPEIFIKRLITLQGQSTTSTTIVGQYAAVAAFDNYETICGDIRERMRERRDIFAEAFYKNFGLQINKPKSSLYYFIPISVFGMGEIDSVEFCRRILEEKNVALVPGAAFGIDGYVRASFGETTQELVAAVEKLAS